MNTHAKLIATAGLLAAVAVCTSSGVSGQAKPAAAQAPKAAAATQAPKTWADNPTSERAFKVKLDFNRWHDVAELQADMRTLEKAHPKFLKYISLGKSYGGRRVEDDLQLCEALLDQAQIAVVPGSAFGAPGYVRFSYATSMETIQKGVERLARFVASAKG